jgi:hypothetical protein
MGAGSVIRSVGHANDMKKSVLILVAVGAIIAAYFLGRSQGRFSALGAPEPGSLAQSPAAHREGGYQLSVQPPGDTPVLQVDLGLGGLFSAQKGMGNRVIAFGGQIETPRGEKFAGILTIVDFSVSKEGPGIGETLTVPVELELGKPYRLGRVNGVVYFYTVTLTKKPSQ